MEIVFLGTGAGLPSKERNVSSIALTLLQELNCTWLFDCGEATQHQILHTSIKPRKIKKIFITHLHGDHIFGLPGLLSSRSFQAGDDKLTVYGPKGIKTYIETSLQISGTHLTYPLKIVEFVEGLLFENDKFIVFVKLLTHGIPSYGFRITEKDTPGELYVEKLRDLGIKPGPIYSTIKSNDITILDDGREIKRKDFIGPPKSGRIICILGDTRSTEKNQAFIDKADVLIHEATFDNEKKDLAHKFYHSTTVQAAHLAKKGKVKKLLLTHISSRYQSSDTSCLENEAKSVFANTTVVKDFYRIKVNKE